MLWIDYEAHGVRAGTTQLDGRGLPGDRQYNDQGYHCSQDCLTVITCECGVLLLEYGGQTYTQPNINIVMNVDGEPAVHIPHTKAHKV